MKNLKDRFVSLNDLHRCLNCRDNRLADIVKILNEFLDSIRWEANTPEFKEYLEEYERQPNENYENLMKDINKLQAKHAKLLVLRVDLEYKRDRNNLFLTENEIYEKHRQAKDDMAHFLNNKRSNKTIFEHMLYYAWKLEYAPSTGFHFHVIFFYDGSKTREDVNRARMIGEYWQDVITKGRGSYFNCNANRKKYPICGIGMFDRRDVNYPDLLIGLEKAVKYLSKPDYYAYVKLTGRSFGRGMIKPKSNRGRPRLEVSSGLSLNTNASLN